MINVQLNLKNSLSDKVNRVKIYRLSRLIQFDISNYFKNIYNFRYTQIKSDLSKILDNYNLNYNIEYEYNEIGDKIIIKIENNMLIEVNVKYEDYSI